jgi:hypothetical protein
MTTAQTKRATACALAAVLASTIVFASAADAGDRSRGDRDRSQSRSWQSDNSQSGGNYKRSGRSSSQGSGCPHGCDGTLDPLAPINAFAAGGK